MIRDVPDLITNVEGNDVTNVCDKEECSSDNKGVNLVGHKKKVSNQTHSESSLD